jgi:hypothetical protein
MDSARRRKPAIGPEPLSPELVLVDPELAAAAREQLREPGAWKPGTAQPARTVARRTRGVTTIGTRAPSSIAPATRVATIPTRKSLRTVSTREPFGSVAREAFPDVGDRAEPSQAYSSRRLLAALAATLLAPFLAASAFAVGVVALGESEGSLLPALATPSASPTAARRPTTRVAVDPQPPPPTARTPRPGLAAPRPVRRRTLRISPAGVEIGGWRVDQAGTVAAAIAAFGRPARRTGGPFYCELVWRGGVRATFYDIDGQEPCRGVFVRAVISGGSWATANGLRIGGPASALRRLYPRAVRRTANGEGWWPLVALPRRTFEPWRPDPRLTARVRRGRVVALYVT